MRKGPMDPLHLLCKYYQSCDTQNEMSKLSENKIIISKLNLDLLRLVKQQQP